VLLELLEGALAVTNATDDVVLALEVCRDRVANGLLVLN
jgi:hypothetical protein